MASKNSVIPFDFNGVNIRTYLRDDQPWFVVADISDALGYDKVSNAIRILDEDEKGAHIVSTLGGKQKMAVCNESGLYSLIIRSSKPEAKRFKKWVTSEVLPAIRRTGQYQATWYTKRHAIASTTKVQAGILQEVRKAIGKATDAVHYMNEHKLINSLLTGEYKGLDRESMTIHQMDFLAHFEIRNTILIGMGTEYPQRKEVLISEAKQWKLDNKPGMESVASASMLPI